jgi:hypothetical protein
MTALTIQQHDLAPALLADRSLLDLDRATKYLAGRLRARTPMGAAEYLEMNALWSRDTYEERLDVAVRVCDLYRTLFPRQYAASQAPLYSLAREQEFYVLVNRHLFPLGDVEDAIRKAPTFFMPGITVESMQAHDWRQGAFDFRRIGTACQLAQVLSGRAWTLTGGYGWREFAALHDLGPELSALRPAPPLCAVGWQLFKYSCAVSGSALQYLPLAFELTNYSTGSVYLDVPGGTFGLEWTGQNVAKLLVARQRASEVLAAVAACEEWLDAAPRLHVGTAVAMWNAAAEIEAQSPHPDTVGPDGEFFVIPELPELYAQMEERL